MDSQEPSRDWLHSLFSCCRRNLCTRRLTTCGRASSDRGLWPASESRYLGSEDMTLCPPLCRSRRTTAGPDERVENSLTRYTSFPSYATDDLHWPVRSCGQSSASYVRMSRPVRGLGMSTAMIVD